MNIEKNKVFLILILLGYFLLSLSFLDIFPFVHSDESWLSGLSKNILENKDFSVTETFFDLKPRNPHAIKILFHSIQIIFLSIMPYSIFTFRLISLIFAVLSLVLIYKITFHMTKNKISALFAASALALDVQFIYASHFARQEVILVFICLAAFYYYIRSDIYYEKKNLREEEISKQTKSSIKKETSTNMGSSTHYPKINSNETSEINSQDLLNRGLKKAIILGSLIGLSIGIHPNSFIISIPFFMLYFYDIFIEKKVSLKSGIIFTLTVSLFAAIYIALSLYFDIDFFANYAAYGSEFEVQSPLTSKFAQSINYYQKLFYGVSGTYYTPEIKLQLILFAITFISAAGIVINKVIQSFFNKPKIENHSANYDMTKLLIAIIGINLGTIIIGRYNQTSVVFQFPFFYILIAVLFSLKNNACPIYKKSNEIHTGLNENYIDDNSKKNTVSTAGALSIQKTCFDFELTTKLIYGFIVLSITLSSTLNIVPFLKYSYDDYLMQLSKYVQPSDTVLANLNAEYYFENGKLFDYRNLAYLEDNDMSFEEYIEKNNIEYIILSEEMEFIYDQRPTWNGIYGSPDYYEEMMYFIENSCSLQGEFSDPIYPMRIVRYIGVDNEFKSYIPGKEWQVRIYKVER